MESRKITIVETRRQKKSVIMSDAETLGELKADMSEAGIDYTDQLFHEVITKTQLISDESLLPKDVVYKGNTTNELIFRLTNKQNNIKNGSVSRTAVYSAIKDFHLEEKCKEVYGKNYTMCKTSDLEDLINKAMNTTAPEKKQISSASSKEKPVVVSDLDTVFKNKLAGIITQFVDVLYKKDLIDDDEKADLDDNIAETFGTEVGEPVEVEEVKSKKPELESSYDDDEIDDLCNF